MKKRIRQPDSLRVLCLDEQGFTRTLLRDMLRLWGITNVTEGCNGYVGLKEMAKNRFDLVITGWNMPDVDGLQFFLACKKVPDLRHIPIIVVADNVSEQHVRKAVKNGLKLFLAKPVSPKNLRKRIEAAVGPIAVPPSHSSGMVF